MTDIYIMVSTPHGYDTKYLFPGSTTHKMYYNGTVLAPYTYTYGSYLYRNGSFATTPISYSINIANAAALDSSDIGGDFQHWLMKRTDGEAGGTIFFYQDGTANPTSVRLQSFSMVTLDSIVIHEQALGHGPHAITFNGNVGNDTLRGSLWNDTFVGGAGKDVIIGGDGVDVMMGGPGHDKIDGGAGGDVVTYGDKHKGISVTLNGSHWVNVKVGGSVEDKIRSIENVVGGAGNDRLVGDGKDNTLIANGGSNTLIGGSGHDGLWAGLGKSTMTGGSGSDTFVLKYAPDGGKAQLITDFSHKNDNIFFDHPNFNNNVTQMDPSLFHNGMHGDTNDFYLYQKSTGKLYFDGDASGPGKPVVIAQFGTGSSHPHLDASDFFWI